VTLNLHGQGDDADPIKFEGHSKEVNSGANQQCILIFDAVKKQFLLERLTMSIRLKKKGGREKALAPSAATQLRNKRGAGASPRPGSPRQSLTTPAPQQQGGRATKRPRTVAHASPAALSNRGMNGDDERSTDADAGASGPTNDAISSPVKDDETMAAAFGSDSSDSGSASSEDDEDDA
jgi:hypothetical protein